MRYLFVLAVLLGSAQAGEGLLSGSCILGEIEVKNLLTDTVALQKATVNGKYRVLLRRIEVPQDAKTYGVFRDYGYFCGTAYAGYKQLPGGYWVYAYPYWFIWAETGARAKARPWGPEQATGAPNSGAGDKRTAWAPRAQNGGKEWLVVEYARPVRPLGVLVYENNAPGALVQIVAYKPDGTAVIVWSGKDPSRTGRPRGTSLIPIRVDFDVARIKLTFATKSVRGWNEVDAVGLLDARGTTHWAKAAHASSFFGDKPKKPQVLVPQHIYLPQPVNLNELAKLRAEVAALTKRLKELEKKLAEG